MAAEGPGEQLALLYDEPEPPVLLAMAEEPTMSMDALLRSIAPGLPARVYAHLTPGLVESLADSFAPESDPNTHLKLGLVDPERLESHDRGDVELLVPGDLDDIEELYARAYPGTWFQARMLETGRYVGIRRDGALVCVAGVHVWSPTWRVATLGNVATIPSARGRASRLRPAPGCVV